MKSPLMYQTTDYDCGPTAVLNALRFLYDRNEIPPEFLSKAYSCMLDRCNGEGVTCRGGTTNAAIRYYVDWLKIYARDVHYNILVRYIDGEDVSFKENSLIRKCLTMGGAAVVRCFAEEDHFITLTGLQMGTSENPYDPLEYVRVFDPWYMEQDLWQNSRIQRVFDRPKSCNLLVPVENMESEYLDWYSLANHEEKCAALFVRTGKGYVIHPETDLSVKSIFPDAGQ